MKYFESVALSLLLIAVQHSTAQNLVQNPGFESGTLADWTATGQVSTITYAPHSGSYAALLASGSDSLSQSIATVSGNTYDITFWFSYAFGTGPTESLSASWGGSQLFSTDTTGGSSPYVEETFDNEIATSISTAIEFNAAVGDSEGFYLDDISVVDVTPSGVPDGGWTAALFGFGIVTLGFFKNCLRRKS
jgi:hypothetical protein